VRKVEERVRLVHRLPSYNHSGRGIDKSSVHVEQELYSIEKDRKGGKEGRKGGISSSEMKEERKMDGWALRIRTAEGWMVMGVPDIVEEEITESRGWRRWVVVGGLKEKEGRGWVPKEKKRRRVLLRFSTKNRESAPSPLLPQPARPVEISLSHTRHPPGSFTPQFDISLERR